ncbi:MAG: HD domain-containing protein [Clostridia bacterium]|nr:HD domain-containing protein [Clostridia bacterium]
MKLIDLNIGDDVEGFYLLKSAALKKANNGKPYLSCTVCDNSDTVDAKVWDYAGPLTSADEGKVIKLRAQVTEYKGTKQLNIYRIREAQQGDLFSLSELIPSAPIAADEAMARLFGYIDSMQDADYRAVCREVLERNRTKFETIPAAKTVHHSFLHGLLMHTVYMADTAAFLASRYEQVLNRDLLLAGTILHDVAKLKEFATSDLGLVTEYSFSGQMLGHLVMGAQEVARVCQEQGVCEEKAVLLQHMLLSHHGEPEFGAAVVPKCAEAELLYYIDCIDSRMEIYRETLEKMDSGTFSDRIFALDKKIYKPL